MTQADDKKRRAALAALDNIAAGATVGIGTGSTVKFLIEGLAARSGLIRRAVSSSEATSARLRAASIAVVDLNELSELDLYIDGADEATRARARHIAHHRSLSPSTLCARRRL